jgi:opacity protein-like surface antigen
MHEVNGGGLYDFHSLNFERTMDSGLLKISFSKNIDLYLNFDRFTKKGESITTFDINRVEFEFDKPIEEESREVAVGVDVHLERYSFILEEKIQDYETTNSLFLPGLADGGAGARYPSTLNYFFLNQPYDLKTYTHTFKFSARPFDSLFIAGSAQLSNQDMDLTYSEDSGGLDYLGSSFSYSYSGTGSFERKIKLYDLDVSYLLFNKLAIIGAVRYHDFEQDGSLTIDGVEESAVLNFDTLGFEGGVQYQFSPKIGLTLGYRHEARKLEGLETVTLEEKTKRNGFFENLKWDFSSSFKLTLDHQRGYYNDPFTLISPTGFDRFRLTAKLRVKKLNISSSYLLKTSESEIGDDRWKSTQNRLNLRVGYQLEKVKIFAGYSLNNIEHTGDRTVAYPPSYSGPAGTFDWNISYEGKSSICDASLSFNPKEDWKIGVYANSYANKGFWEISRTMLKAYIDYTFADGLTAQLGYRYVNYNDKSSGSSDYRANILEVSFGYRWK